MRHPKIKMLMLFVLAGLGVPASAQTTVPVKYADTTLNLVIPKGHCIIPREDELGSLHYKLQEDGNRGSSKVAVLFADCREWASRRANPALLLQNHGNYLLQLTGGRELLLPPSTTRSDVVQIYVEHEKKKLGSNEDLSERIRKKFADSTVTAPALEGNVNVGLIDTDDRAAYLGVGGTMNYEGKLVRVVGVIGATSIRSVPTTLNLYGPSTQGNPFRALLSQQKVLIQQLVAANE